MSRPGARAASRLNRSVQSEPLVFRIHRSEFSAEIVARPSGWLTSTFRMAICRDTYNSAPDRIAALNVVLHGWGVYSCRYRRQSSQDVALIIPRIETSKPDGASNPWKFPGHPK